MVFLRHGFLGLVLFMSIATILCNTKPSTENKAPLTPNVYVKMLRTQRRDHTILIQNMLKADYAKNYKMISLALEKIFHVIKESNHTLITEKYSANDGFPIDQVKQEAVILLLENTCLAADILLHFPEISYKVLKKVTNWREAINWCLDFVNKFPHITDELIVELMDLVRQEINESARNSDFINPYYTKADSADKVAKQKTKPTKKLKKGPRLTTNTEL